MPNAAVIATLPDTSSRAWTLRCGMFDLNVAGQNGAPWIVPIDTIRVDEQGPGGVSSMTFDIWDTTSSLVLDDGAPVELVKVAAAVPQFAGFLTGWTNEPAFGGSGQIIHASCTGAEAILDWAILQTADVTFASGSLLTDAVQSLAAAVTQTGPLRPIAPDRFLDGFQSGPLGWFLNVNTSNAAALTYDVTVSSGSSLRDGLDALAASAAPNTRGNASSPGPALARFTVDFWWGLRGGADDNVTGTLALDYVNLTVTDTVAGLANPGAVDLQHTTEVGAVVRAVHVRGSSGTFSGTRTDGSGKMGPTAFIEDSTVDSAAKLFAAQLAYLTDHTVKLRGTIHLGPFVPADPMIRAGSLLNLTDDQADATGTYRIWQITKTFVAGGREEWDVTYGGLRRSAIRQLRRLTRGIRS